MPRFERTNHNMVWTPFRHPVAVRSVQAGRTVPIDGATTSCGAWFLADAVEGPGRGSGRDRGRAALLIQNSRPGCALIPCSL